MGDFNMIERFFAPESTVRRRVDYVFVGPVREAQAVVRHSQVVLDSPEVLPDGTTLWPSDHYGVLADIDLSAR